MNMEPTLGICPPVMLEVLYMHQARCLHCSKKERKKKKRSIVFLKEFLFLFKYVFSPRFICFCFIFYASLPWNVWETQSCLR